MNNRGGEFAVCVFLLVVAAGCAKPLVFDRQYKEGLNPNLNEKAVATTGSTILEEFNYQSARSAIIKTNVYQEKGMGLKFNVPAGMPCHMATYEKKIIYCSEKPTVTDAVGTLFGFTCFKDSNDDNQFDRLTHNYALSMGMWWDLDSPVYYKKKVTPINTGHGMRKELIYQGLSNDVIRIVYREFIDNLARPAFTQELQYTLKVLPTEISFKKSKIQVLSADNNKIEYIVKSKF